MEHSKITLTPIAESMNNHVDILKKASDSLIKVSKLSDEGCIQVDIDADLETIGTAYYLLKKYYSNALHRHGFAGCGKKTKTKTRTVPRRDSHTSMVL